MLAAKVHWRSAHDRPIVRRRIFADVNQSLRQICLVQLNSAHHPAREATTRSPTRSRREHDAFRDQHAIDHTVPHDRYASPVA